MTIHTVLALISLSPSALASSTSFKETFTKLDASGSCLIIVTVDTNKALGHAFGTAEITINAEANSQGADCSNFKTRSQTYQIINFESKTSDCHLNIRIGGIKGVRIGNGNKQFLVDALVGQHGTSCAGSNSGSLTLVDPSNTEVHYQMEQ